MAGAAEADGFLAQRALAGEEEQGALAELRRKLEPELEELRGRGHDFPHTTGDVFLLRALRGCEGDVERAAAWYRRCLEARKQYGLDGIFQTIHDIPFDVARLPGSDDVSKYLRTISNETTMRTPKGDLIQCDYVGDVRWGKFMAEVGLEKYFTWQLHVHEAKLAALDRLSRESGHIVKLVAFVDMRDLKLPPKEFMDVEKKLKTSVFEVTGPEIVHRILFLSVPRFFHTLYRMARPLLPARTAGNIRLLGRDFAEDPEAIAEAGGPLLAKIVAARCTGATDDESSLVGRACVVSAGSTFDRGVPVAAGQTVSWTFRVGGREELAAANARGRIGGLMDVFSEATDLLFEVTALWDPEEGEVSKAGDDSGLIVNVVAPAKVSGSDGDIEGSLLAKRSGIVMLRWTNFHSWVRAKALASFKVCVDGQNAAGKGA